MRTSGLLPVLALVPSLLASCGSKEKEELGRRLSEANDKVVACRKEVNDLKNQVGALKKQLAEAVANPSRITLTDPEIIELIGSLKGQAGEEPLLGKGSLDPKLASKVVMANAQALRACYERALKKNSALQYQSGLGVTLEITVKPQGSVEDVGVRPLVDQGLTSCIQTTIQRWKFPTFAGGPITIEQNLTLTPEKS
jgi:hypothetical protein